MGKRAERTQRRYDEAKARTAHAAAHHDRQKEALIKKQARGGKLTRKERELAQQLTYEGVIKTGVLKRLLGR